MKHSNAARGYAFELQSITIKHNAVPLPATDRAGRPRGRPARPDPLVTAFLQLVRSVMPLRRVAMRRKRKRMSAVPVCHRGTGSAQTAQSARAQCHSSQPVVRTPQRVVHSGPE